MTSTQNSTNTPQDIDALVEKMLKEFDITKMHEIGYDKLQEIANQYLQSDNPELKELGQELKDLDPKIFELSPSEEEVRQLCDILEKSGKTKDEAQRFGISLLELAIKKTTQDIVNAMSDESRNEWESLNAFSPNVLQQVYLLDETAKLLLGKSYDNLYDEALSMVVKIATSLLSEQQKVQSEISSLTEEQASTIKTAFNANQYELAIQLIFNFAQENAINK